MKDYYVTENNSGGITKVLSCLIEKGTTKRPHIVKIVAENVDEAIEKFEKKFKTNWMYENSYDGGSCNCCGRRFKIYTPDVKEEDDNIKYVWHYTEIPYMWGNKEDRFLKTTFTKLELK